MGKPLRTPSSRPAGRRIWQPCQLDLIVGFASAFALRATAVARSILRAWNWEDEDASFDQRYRGHRPCTGWRPGNGGAMVTQRNVQAILWAIDGSGLVMAAALLATKYFRAGHDVVAGGFLVFAIGEGVIMLSAPAAGLAGSTPAFAAGTALWGRRFSSSAFPGCSPCQSRSLAS